jgi:BlaI family penicillinase repressor
MRLADKISEAELEVMKILWRERRPVSFAELRVELGERKVWEKTTIGTLLTRLLRKGVIDAEKRGVLYYTPKVTEEDYVQAQEQNMIDKLYGGSAKNLVAAMVRGGRLSDRDIAELRQLFEASGGDGK